MQGFVIENLKGGKYYQGHGNWFSENLVHAKIFPTWQKAEKDAQKNGFHSYLPNGSGDFVLREVDRVGKSLFLRSSPLAISNPFDEPMEDLKIHLRSLPKATRRKLFRLIMDQANHVTIADILSALKP